MSFSDLSTLLLVLVILFNLYTVIRDHIIYDFSNIIVLIIAILRLIYINSNQIALYSIGFVVGLTLSVMFMKNLKKDVINGDVIKLTSCFGVVFGSYYIAVIFLGFIVLYSTFSFGINKFYKGNEQKINKIDGKISSIILLLAILLIGLFF